MLVRPQTVAPGTACFSIQQVIAETTSFTPDVRWRWAILAVLVLLPTDGLLLIQGLVWSSIAKVFCSRLSSSPPKLGPSVPAA